MRSKKFFLLAITIALLLLGLYYAMLKLPKTQQQDDLIELNKQSLLSFQLVASNGAIFDAAKLKGKPTLVYFGFTFCPDICPASLNKLVAAIDVLKKYNFDFNAVFISIDPERDTPESLNKYMKFFSPDIIALTGTNEQIAAVAKLFNVYYAKDEQSDPENYMLNHSSFIYLLDRDGKLINTFSFAQKSDDIIEFFRIKLR